LLFTALLSEQRAVAATYYYVATTGNDMAGDGSLGNPGLTVSKGIRSLRAGDTLYIRRGTYTLSQIYGLGASDTFGCIPSCPTSWETATKIMNYPGEAVVVRTIGFDMTATNWATGLSYFIIEGDTRANFVFEYNGTWCESGPVGSGLNTTTCLDAAGFRFATGTHHVRLKRLTIRNFTSNGLMAGGCGPHPHHIELIDNEIRHNGNCSACLLGGYNQEHGFYLECGDDFLIQHNYFVGNYAYGLHMYTSSAGRLSNNVIDGNIFEGRTLPLTGSGSWTAGLVVAGNGHTVTNNLVIAQGTQRGRHSAGVQIQYPSVSSPSNTVIYNNTIYDTDTGIVIAKGTNIIAKNNLLHVRGKNADITSSTGTVMGNNLCSTDDSDAGCSVVTNTPGFITPGSNFRLADGSSAIDRGATILTVTKDRDGRPRPQGATHDIGAFEGGGSSTGALSPPRNLTVR
jgi:hypothetical protein